MARPAAWAQLSCVVAIAVVQTRRTMVPVQPTNCAAASVGDVYWTSSSTNGFPMWPSRTRFTCFRNAVTLVRCAPARASCATAACSLSSSGARTVRCDGAEVADARADADLPDGLDPSLESGVQPPRPVTTATSTTGVTSHRTRSIVLLLRPSPYEGPLQDAHRATCTATPCASHDPPVVPEWCAPLRSNRSPRDRSLPWCNVRVGLSCPSSWSSRCSAWDGRGCASRRPQVGRGLALRLPRGGPADGLQRTSPDSCARRALLERREDRATTHLAMLATRDVRTLSVRSDRSPGRVANWLGSDC